MNIHSEKEYLKELKFTHEKQIKSGKINSASNTMILINDCEARIEKLNKLKKVKPILDNNLVTWKEIKGFESHLISNKGEVKRKSYTNMSVTGVKRFYPETIVDTFLDNGYLSLLLAFNLKYKKARLSRLVYENFNGEIPKNFAIKFKNGNPYDCSSENLYAVKRDVSEKFKMSNAKKLA